MDMLAYTPMDFNYLETLAKTFIIPGRQNHFIQKCILNNAPVRRIATAMNTSSAFTGLYTKNPLWYQQFDIRQIGILRGCHPIVDFEAADKCRLFLVTRKAMDFQVDFTSIPIDIFRDYNALVLNLTSMQDATEKCPYPELVAELQRLELNFTFTLEHGTKWSNFFKCSWQVWLCWKNYLKRKISLQQVFSQFPLLKYRYRGSFSSDYIPTFDNDTFAIIYTQPSIMQGELWILIANSRRSLYSPTFSVDPVSSSSSTNRWCQKHYNLIPAFAVCTPYMQRFISSSSDKKRLLEFSMLMYFKLEVITSSTSFLPM